MLPKPDRLLRKARDSRSIVAVPFPHHPRNAPEITQSDSPLMNKSLTLDAVDWRILRELQGDGRVTNVELARRAGISPPPCLRRVRALEKAGVIKGYRAVLDQKQLGFDVTMFAMVGLHSQAEADLIAFEERVAHLDVVRECYMLSGEVDFLLKCVAPDLATAQDFVINELTSLPNVDSVKTTLTLRQSKADAAIPLSVEPA